MGKETRKTKGTSQSKGHRSKSRVYELNSSEVRKISRKRKIKKRYLRLGCIQLRYSLSSI